MKYLEINYGKSVNQITGESWEKVSAKVSIGDEENPDKCFEDAKSKVGGWLGKGIDKGTFGIDGWTAPPQQAVVVGTINKEKERIEIAIENSTTIEDLKTYESLSMKYDLVQEYINKKKQLS